MATLQRDARSEYDLPDLEEIELGEIRTTSSTSSQNSSRSHIAIDLTDSSGLSSTRTASESNLEANSEADANARKQRTIVVVAWVSLLVAVLAWSVMGPSFVYLNRKGIPPVLAACWRNQCVLFFILGPMLYQLYQTTAEQRRRWIMPFVMIEQIDATRAAVGLPRGSATSTDPKSKTSYHEAAQTVSTNHTPSATPNIHSTQTNSSNLSTMPDDLRGDDHDLSLASPTLDLDFKQDDGENEPNACCTWSIFKARVAYHYNVTLDCPIVYTLLSGLFWTASLSLWVISLKYTSTTLASLFSSLSPVVLVGWLKLKKKPVSTLEIVGVFISLLGVGFCVLSGVITGDKNEGEGESHRVATGTAGNLFGALLNMLASFALAGGTVVGAKSRSELPLFVHTMISTSTIAICQMMLAAALEGATLTGYPTQLPDGTSVPAHMTAIFGWAHGDVIRVIMFLAFMGGWIGLVGFNLSILYVPPLAYTVIQLLDPPLTGVVSYAMDLEPLPKWPVYLGAAILLSGIFVLVYGEDRRTKAEKLATEAQKGNEQATEAKLADKDGVKSGQSSPTFTSQQQQHDGNIPDFSRE